MTEVEWQLVHVFIFIFISYLNFTADRRVQVQYIPAHTGHDLGCSELKHLPLPGNTKQEVAVKLSMGIPPERILEGK